MNALFDSMLDLRSMLHRSLDPHTPIPPPVFDMPDLPKSFFLSPELHKYILDHSDKVDAVQQALIDETQSVPKSHMQISPEQGAFMTILTKALGAKHAIEIGTYTGYSAISIARGLPADGTLLCCDVNEEWTNIAKKHWAAAKVQDKIALVLAPAVDTLRALPREETFDLAFIDADKASYLTYFELLLSRMKTNGVILVDNTLWAGRIISAMVTDADTLALRRFNDIVAVDPRVDRVLLSIGDGLTMLRKR